MSQLTRDQILKIFDYHPEDGTIWWRSDYGGKGITAQARAKPIGNDADRYYRVIIRHPITNTRTYLYIHRIIYFLETGVYPENIDHKSRNKHENQFRNLRACTEQENVCNRLRQSNNSSGRTGVYRDSTCDRWFARVKWNGKHTHLGMFQNFDDAVRAREEAEIAIMGGIKPKDAVPILQ